MGVETKPASAPAGATETGDTPPICLFCGEPEDLWIEDIWTDHSFLLGTCCPDLLENVVADMHEDPAWGRALMRRLGAEAYTGYKLRRVCDGTGQTPMLDHALEVRDIGFAEACRFVLEHHAHCGPPKIGRFTAAIYNGGTLLGVAMTGNPVSRAYTQRGGIVEVNRLCIRRDVAHMLRKDACSKLYAWSAREAQRRGFHRIITYTREDEEGTSLIAAGWEREAVVRGRGWHGGRRRRSNRNAWVDKVRWGRKLHPKPLEIPPPVAPDTRPVPDWMFADRRPVPSPF